jgi:hypothetical protein
MHTPITFTVKAYNVKGTFVDSDTYHTPKLNQFNGHWCVVQRMATTLLKNKKAKSLRYFMDDVEYTYNVEQCEFVKA